MSKKKPDANSGTTRREVLIGGAVLAAAGFAAANPFPEMAVAATSAASQPKKEVLP